MSEVQRQLEAYKRLLQINLDYGGRIWLTMAPCGLEHSQEIKYWKYLSFYHDLTCQILYKIPDQTPAGMTHQTHSMISLDIGKTDYFIK